MMKSVAKSQESAPIAEKETIYSVKYELIKDSENILIAGQEFQFNNITGNYKYWYCKYRRAQPRICKASCRQDINSANKKVVELMKAHASSEDSKSCCPYISGITELCQIKTQFMQQTTENEILTKIGKLLEENPTWDLLDLKANASKHNIDLVHIAQAKLNANLREHKRRFGYKGFNAVLENKKTKLGTIMFREYCEYNINVMGTEVTNKYVIWASPAQISRLRVSEHWYLDGTFRICPDTFTQLIIID